MQRLISWTLGSLLLIGFNFVAWLLTFPLGRRTKWAFYPLLAFVLFLGWIVPVGDRRSDTAAAAVSLDHSYGLVSWEFDNFFDKWAHRIWTVLPWTPTGLADRRRDLDRYVELVDELRVAEGRLNTFTSSSDPRANEILEAQVVRNRLLKERDGLRDSVEQYLEQAITDAVRTDRIDLIKSFVWPPVDFRIDNPPKLLVTSPRDEIRRIEDVLIDPDISSEQMSKVESELEDSLDVSAVILQTGGLASYPNVVPTTDLKRLLDVAAHEWLHAHLTFHSLGMAYFDGGDIRSVNETLADMFGREVGLLVYSEITGEPFTAPRRPETAMRKITSDDPDSSSETENSDEFNFNRFMAETRERTDELLSEGRITEAEAYMESRRIELLGHNFTIRKINQAYFAFHGTYAESPSSTSPIARYLWDLREQVATVGELVKLLRPLGTYREFEQLLSDRGIDLEKSE